MFLLSYDSSEVPTHAELVYLLFNFRFRVEFFLFSRLSIASLLCEWSWAIRLSAAIVVASDSKKALYLS
jgi:hypothetical protein